MTRRDALLALVTGGASVGVVGFALLHRGLSTARGVKQPRVRPKLQPFPADLGTLSHQDKQLLWQLAVATGALWSMSDLSESELLGFLDLKTQAAPSYLNEYRNALSLFTVACRDHSPPDAVDAILRQAANRQEVEHARQFVIGEFILLHLARGGFHQFGLTRFPGFIGDGYRASPIQPGTRR